MTKKTVFKILLLLFFSLGLLSSPVKAQENTVNLYLFSSEFCPHCKKEAEFINKIAPDYPNLVVYDFEVSQSQENITLLQELGKEMDVDVGGVPMTFIADEYFIGYLSDETTGDEIIRLIEKYQGKSGKYDKFIQTYLGNDIPQEPQATPRPTDTQDNPGTPETVNEDINVKSETSQEENNTQTNTQIPEYLYIPFLGQVQLKSLSLPALTFFIALLDGFNPCAMWVLLFLIGILTGMKDRKRMWILGGAFILASGFVYFLFLTAWLNLFLFLGYINLVRILVGLIAVSAGAFQLNDFRKNKNAACKIVQEEKRKKVFGKIRESINQKNLALSLVGIIGLAFAVNLIELVCSAGLPAIYTNMLSLTPMPRSSYYLYLLFYILIFMLDDFIVFVVAVKTLHAIGISSKYSNYSKLIGGLIIFLLGMLMLFKPELLMFA
jgi:thiol-disulfide isomerase/thioredoxin